MNELSISDLKAIRDYHQDKLNLLIKQMLLGWNEDNFNEDHKYHSSFISKAKRQLEEKIKQWNEQK